MTAIVIAHLPLLRARVTGPRRVHSAHIHDGRASRRLESRVRRRDSTPVTARLRGVPQLHASGGWLAAGGHRARRRTSIPEPVVATAASTSSRPSRTGGGVDSAAPADVGPPELSSPPQLAAISAAQRNIDPTIMLEAVLIDILRCPDPVREMIRRAGPSRPTEVELLSAHLSGQRAARYPRDENTPARPRAPKRHRGPRGASERGEIDVPERRARRGAGHRVSDATDDAQPDPRGRAATGRRDRPARHARNP